MRASGLQASPHLVPVGGHVLNGEREVREDRVQIGDGTLDAFRPRPHSRLVLIMTGGNQFVDHGQVALTEAFLDDPTKQLPIPLCHGCGDRLR